MKTIFFSLLLFCVAGATLPAFARTAADAAVVRAVAATEPDSKQMEKDLQRLPWKKFRAIVESVPKLKADVEAFGSIGWQYVQANYRTYGWKKNIDKLDALQKKRLAELIHSAKDAK